MILVVDASVAIQWYIPEEHAQEAETLLSDDFQLHAPELLLPEITNVLWKKCQAADISDLEAETALNFFRSRKIVLHQHKDLIRTALSGAIETRQSAYDWIYLALALSLSCTFVTADRRFFLAIRKTRFKGHVILIENVGGLI